MTSAGDRDSVEHDAEEPSVTIRDRRTVDSEPGEPRDEEAVTAEIVDEHGKPIGGAADAVASPGDPETESLRTELNERTADLQRVSAEFANYRKRVDRDRESVIAAAKAGLVTDLLPLLDDLERAAAHGDLTGAFKSVADKLVATLDKAGLQPFGTEGEPFDPSVHEAVQHNTSSEVDGPTVSTVLRRGFRFGDRVVRSAMVAVTDYEAPPVAEPEPVGFTEPVPDTDEQR